VTITHPTQSKRAKVATGIIRQRHATASGSKPKLARNRRDKGTLFLSESHAIKAIEAAAFADKIDRPLNHAIAIHFDKGGMTRRAQDFIGHYLRLANQWLSDRGAAPTYIWNLEHATNDTEKGLHVHALVHVPRDLGDDFRKLARGRWAKLAGIINLVPGVVHIQPVGEKGQRYYYPEHSDNTHQRKAYRRGIKWATGYQLKAINPATMSTTVSKWQRTFPPTDPSATADTIRTAQNEMIYGRRISLSQNITSKAQARWEAEQANSTAAL
jgi:hypothetical protein